MRLPEWCQTHSFKEFLELFESIELGHSDPRKGKNMNEHFQPVVQTEPEKLTDEQLEKLLASIHEPVDGEVAGYNAGAAYITTDDEDETEDQKVN